MTILSLKIIRNITCFYRMKIFKDSYMSNLVNLNAIVRQTIIMSTSRADIVLNQYYNVYLESGKLDLRPLKDQDGLEYRN